MNRPILTRFWIIPAILFLFLFFQVFGQESPRIPRWWDIELHLSVEGQYSIREADASTTGEYDYAAAWSGSMEKDDSDYLLYHSGFEPLRWEAREKASSGSDPKVLTEMDIDERPTFRMNYILNEDGILRIDFIIEGFLVPRSGAGKKFDLILPASKKDANDLSPSTYDAGIAKGSNEIVFEEKMVQAGPVERVFRWEWKRSQRSSGPGVRASLSSGHKVEVKVAITPRY